MQVQGTRELGTLTGRVFAKRQCQSKKISPRMHTLIRGILRICFWIVIIFEPFETYRKNHLRTLIAVAMKSQL